MLLLRPYCGKRAFLTLESSLYEKTSVLVRTKVIKKAGLKLILPIRFIKIIQGEK
jgi:hypothetical protein